MRIELASICSPVFGRSVHVQVREVDEHSWLENHSFARCSETSFPLDDAKGCWYAGVEAVDLHDDGVEVRHFCGHGGEINGINGLDLSH